MISMCFKNISFALRNYGSKFLTKMARPRPKFVLVTPRGAARHQLGMELNQIGYSSLSCDVGKKISSFLTDRCSKMANAKKLFFWTKEEKA